MSPKNEAQEYLREKIDEIAATISLEKFSNKPGWARANFDYGRNMLLLAEIDKNFFSCDLYEEAILAFKNAMIFYQNNNDIINNCAASFALSRGLRYYAIRKGDQAGLAYLKKADKLLKKLHNTLQNSEYYIQQVMLKCEQANLMRDFMQLSPMQSHLLYLKKSINLYKQSLNILRVKEDYTNWQHVLILLGNLYSEMSVLQNTEQASIYLKNAIEVFESIIKATDVTVNSKDIEPPYENLVAHLELAFLYSSMARISNNDKYIAKALNCFQKISNNNQLNFSIETILRIEQEKAYLLYKHANLQSDLYSKITSLKKAASLYKINLKQLEQLNYINEIMQTYTDLSKIFDILANIVLSPKEKNIYLEEAISYYKKSLKYITDKTKLILIYKKLARNEATLAITNKDNNKYLMCKSYRHALLYLHKALKLTETKSPVYYNLQLKIISIMRDLGKYNKPLKIYYNAAIKFLKNVQDSNKFSLHYNKIKQDIDKIFIKNKFKYTIQKLLGFNF